VDIDGQEVRNLGHYLWPLDGGAYAIEVVKGDIHTKVQNMIGFNTRSVTKNVEYSLIYGAGNPKLGLYAMKDAFEAGKSFPANADLGKIGKKMRAAILEGIPAYEKLLQRVQSIAKAKGRLRGIDGRTLWVRSPHSALNLLLQSCGIIHMKMLISMLRPALEDVGFLYGEDWALVLWVHDEIQIEARPEIAEAIGAIASSLVPTSAEILGIRTPMTGSYKVGNNWQETH
jgi:DNA polymerase I-like protein with 3'-5' exonuclease and polymerase domains